MTETRKGAMIAIRRNADGAIRMYHDEYFSGEENDYMWTEGNYSCDCNRHLFFVRATGEGDEDEAECGDEKYTALYAEMPDGRKIQIDDNG